MTPKEKAEELVNNLKNGLFKDRGVRIYSEDAIYCALIAVDEILNLNFNINCDATERCVNPVIEFWQQVKKQIEKL